MRTQKVAKNWPRIILGHFNMPGIRYSKSDYRYWKTKVFFNTYTYKGKKFKQSDYSVRFSEYFQRHTFGLGTGNKDEAARKAREIFLFRELNGWEPTLEKYKPKGEQKVESPTVEIFLNEIRDKTTLKPDTLYSYKKKFRRLIAEACGLKHEETRVGKGNLALRKKVNKVMLSELTPAKIMTWKKKYLSKARNEEEKRARVQTVNSIIRNSKSLFSANNIVFVAAEIGGSKHAYDRSGKRTLKGRLIIPHDPFEDVSQEKVRIRKYDAQRAGMDLGKLFKLAQNELLPSKPELYKVFLIAAVSGLRRKEIDWLQWDHIDFKQKLIYVQASTDYELKSAESENLIAIDEFTANQLKKLKRKSKGKFVVSTSGRNSDFSKPGSYRCGYLFKQLCKWLRKHGVKSQKPIHTLRQEATSIIADQHGIHAASSFARHSDIRITSQIYVENRKLSKIETSSLLKEKAY